MMKFTFGSDPEFMLSKDNKFYSAIRILKHDKHNRIQIGNHEYYYDNVLAECAVAPGNTKEEVVSNFRDCLQQFVKIVSPYKLVLRSSQDYPPDQLTEKEAKEIGCDTEYCVYSLSDVKPPTQEFVSNCLRTAGGHIHLGTELAFRDEYSALFVIRLMDLFLGIPSIFLDKDKTAKRRKRLYGKAGRFRLPEHGVEYRSLGNFWWSTPELVELTWDICQFVLEYVETEKHLDLWTIDHETLNDPDAWIQEGFTPASCYHCHGYDVNEMRVAIDNVDKAKGRKFMSFIKDLLPSEIFDRIELCSTTLEKGFYSAWRIKE